jgi:hypothetical protein
MKYIFWLDHRIIWCAEKITQPIEAYTGITNFTLARSCCFIAILSRIANFVLWPGSTYRYGKTAYLFIIFIDALVIRFLLAKEVFNKQLEEKIYKEVMKGNPNYGRTNFGMILLRFGIYITTITFGILYFSTGIDASLVTMGILVTLGYIFLACNPAAPKSKKVLELVPTS